MPVAVLTQHTSQLTAKHKHLQRACTKHSSHALKTAHIHSHQHSLLALNHFTKLKQLHRLTSTDRKQLLDCMGAPSSKKTQAWGCQWPTKKSLNPGISRAEGCCKKPPELRALH